MKWLELIQAVGALLQAAIPLPNWSDEEGVKTWLHDMEGPLARLIVLLVGTQKVQLVQACDAEACSKLARAVSESYAEALRQAGGDPAAVDWAALIDVIAKILASLFPQYAQAILIVAEIIKQLLAAKAI